MPADHGLGTYDEESVPSVEESRPPSQRDPSERINAPGPYTPFDIPGELPTKEQNLGFERVSGSKRQAEPGEQVGYQSVNDVQEAEHRLIMPYSRRGGADRIFAHHRSAAKAQFALVFGDRFAVNH